MWYTLEEKKPEEQKEMVIWVKARHNGMEFPHWAIMYGETWYVGGHSLDKMGWDFLAWFDIPPYR